MKTFTITAGHGGNGSGYDPGAVAFGRHEADIAVNMRNAVVLYLRGAGIKVTTDGEGKNNLSLREAIKLIPLSDLALEFHCNASALPTAKGVEVLSHTKHEDISKRIAAAINKEAGYVLRRDKGWYKDPTNHSRLGFVRGGGIIVELFFITNMDELTIWDAKFWLIAKAVASVLIEYAQGK